MLDFNYLKQNHKRIYYFGLGFIQVVLNETIRYHFYHPDLPAFVEHPHNHRYDFNSTIIKGCLNNTIYIPEEGSEYILYKESCHPEKQAPKEELLVNMKSACHFTAVARTNYFMAHNTFHTVKPFGETITRLFRSDYKKEFADVTRPNGTDHVCPFAKKMEEDELWDIVKDMMM